jgi:hypothetical protein
MSQAPEPAVLEADVNGASGKSKAPIAPPTSAQIETDESKLISAYANFCRVTGTPEELIVDFGLNPQPMGAPTHPIQVTQRIVVNYFTAKRLLAALQMSVQRHESVFGVLETDVQKRVAPASLRSRP